MWFLQVSYEKSFEVAAEENKPIMLIIHKTWCGACAALKPKVEWSRPIWELSKYFVMVNVEVKNLKINVSVLVFFFKYPGLQAKTG